MKWKKILLLTISLLFIFSLCGCKGKIESTEDYIAEVCQGFFSNGINKTLFSERIQKLQKFNLFGEHILEDLDMGDNIYIGFAFQLETKQIIISSLPRNKIIILLKEDQKAPTIRFKFELKEINKVSLEYNEVNPAEYIEPLYIFSATIRISPEDWENIKNKKDESASSFFF